MSKAADCIREELIKARVYDEPLSPAEERLLVICRMLTDYIETIECRGTQNHSTGCPCWDCRHKRVAYK